MKTEGRRDKRSRRELAARLVAFRQGRGWSQGNLADRLGVPRPRIAKWEAGHHSPSQADLVHLALLYGVSCDELLTGRKTLADEL